MSETQLQMAVAEYLDRACPDPWSAIGHGANVGRRKGAELKRMGLKPGMPDLLIFRADGTISIELKIGKGRQTAEQRTLGAWLNAQPAHSYHVCRSIDDVAEVLKVRGVVRRVA